MTEEMQLVRAAVYTRFVETGHAPIPDELATTLGWDPVRVRATLGQLAEAHLLVLAPGGESIWMAHPFSGTPTPFRVQSGTVDYWANCAWDAFGIAAVLGTDTRATARCGWSNETLDLSVNDGAAIGTGMVHLPVPPRRFWDNVAFT